VGEGAVVNTKLVLTAEIVADEHAVSKILDDTFAEHPALVRASRRIKKRQKELQRAASKAAWRKYLAVEEAHNAREIVELDLFVAWAFEQGRRFERERLRGRR
jgi:hypothetical protein